MTPPTPRGDRTVIELVDNFHETSDFHGVARVFWTVVPAFTAAGITWQHPKTPLLLLMHVRKPFDERTALRVIDLVNRHWDGRARGRGMYILPGLANDPTEAMDVVVLLRKPHLDKFGTIDA